MCLNNVIVPTNTRYVSLRYHDKFMQSFGCGHCAECVQMVVNQMSFRCNVEFDELPKDGYVMFDCLSYSNKYVPHLSDFWEFLDKKDDYMCFNRKHLRNFLQAFRQRIIRNGYDYNKIKVYYACEYGTKPHMTHRPHIHLMFFVGDGNIEPLFLSSLISDVWKFGRTDGIPYKTKLYVLSHNVVRSNNTASRYRSIAYMSKYLQKSCKLQSALDVRVSKVMRKLAEREYPDNPDEWLDSEVARRKRLELLRMVNQYHRTSNHFGESALASFDFRQIADDGCVWMKDAKRINMPVPLSTYYKRKMFYEKIIHNGSQYWQLNDLGKEYVRLRHDKLIQRLADRYSSLACKAKISIDSLELAKYVIDYRGRIKSIENCESSSIVDRYDNISYYNYSSVGDKLHFGCRGLSKYDYGNTQIGYSSFVIHDYVSVKDFISRHVFFDEKYEECLELLLKSMEKVVKGKQRLYNYKQYLSNLYKQLSFI